MPGQIEKAMYCSKCKKEIQAGNEYRNQAAVFCEACCMEVRTPRVRKTHWQYIRSIKGSYLIPAQKKNTKPKDIE